MPRVEGAVMDVVVIGAGIYGAAVAAALTRRGAGVTVLDSGVPAGGTSGATFSWTNASGKVPRTYHDLNVAGMAAHRALATEVPGSDWYHEPGNLEWADDDQLRHKVDRVLEWGYEARWLTRREAVALEPDLDPAALPDDGIAFFPHEGWVDPPRLVDHLITGIDVVRHDAVTGIEVAGEAVRSVRLASGRRLTADAVVNCAGPRAAEVAAMAGLDLPMCNTHGVLVHTTPVAVTVSRVVHAPAVHLRPNGTGRLLLHRNEADDAAQAGTVDQAAVDEVLTAGRALYPGLRAATIESVRVGERPIPGDGFPVLGRALALPNLYFAVSHSGATLGLHAGGLVAAEVLGDDVSAELAPFRFDRFAEHG